jgi:DMSO/TMAO reductase YedYZ molybdopterin-dependent catalytic subunit
VESEARHHVGAEGDVVRHVVGPIKDTWGEPFVPYGTNAEMQWGSVEHDAYLTSNDRFFVRSQSTTPVIDSTRWRLVVDGPAVRRSIELSYEDLLSLPRATYVRALECAGNGRRYFSAQHGRIPPGTPWGLGAIGVARWSGVRLADVLDLAELRETARFVVPEGLDRERVRRPLPVTKALEDDTLLAFEMNGEPLPVDHGFPVRLIVSGWAAIASIKWLGRIEVSEQPVWTRWNTEVYVLTGGRHRPMDGGHPTPVEEQVVKSALELAWNATIQEGSVIIAGRAWSPEGTITSVEYSIDRGPWMRAPLPEPNLRRAWARFTVPWDATAGSHSIRTRATDDQGATQPEADEWNDHGYLSGGIVEHPVTVTGSRREQP